MQAEHEAIQGRKLGTKSWEEHIGLYPRKCAICSKTFEAAAEYRYKIVHKGHTAYYCSYSHFRLHDKKEREDYKQSMLSRWTDRTSGMTERARVEAEVCRCQKKLEEWMARTQEPGFKELHWKKRSAINQTVVKWRTKLLLAEQRLEEMKSEAGQSV